MSPVTVARPLVGFLVADDDAGLCGVCGEKCRTRDDLGSIHPSCTLRPPDLEPFDPFARARREDAASDAPQPPPKRSSSLAIASVNDVAARVDAAPPPGWLFEPVWPGDAYGVLAAEDKAGKTWADLDGAVSVASGTPWMGAFPCSEAGPVLAFLGEGGERKMLRRLRAIAAQRGLAVESLPIRLCFRVPRLTSDEHVTTVAQELDAHPARLVIVDPLYLAAAGARGSDLYEMGAHLERVQQVAQAAGAALQVVTHWNKTGEGRGAKRITGVGPGAWGRVLATAAVEHRHTETAGLTAVTLAWEFMGDEIPETELRIRRRVWADDPSDLSSPLHYEVEVLDPASPGAGSVEGMRPATKRVLAVLEAAPTAVTVREIGDDLARDSFGIPLKARTIQVALKELEGVRMAESDGAFGASYVWRATSAPSEVENAF